MTSIKKDTAWYVANAKKNHQAKVDSGEKVTLSYQFGGGFGTPGCLK